MATSVRLLSCRFQSNRATFQYKPEGKETHAQAAVSSKPIKQNVVKPLILKMKAFHNINVWSNLQQQQVFIQNLLGLTVKALTCAGAF